MGENLAEGQEGQDEVNELEEWQDHSGELRDLGKSQEERMVDQEEPDKRPMIMQVFLDLLF